MKSMDFDKILGKEFRAIVWVIMWGKYPVASFTSQQEATRVLELIRRSLSTWQRIIFPRQVYMFAVKMIA